MSERKLTLERQIMDALGIRPGSPYSVNVRKEINKSKKGETVEMAASRVRATIGYKNWAVMNEKLKAKEQKSKEPKSSIAIQNERIGVLYTRLDAAKGSANWKEVRSEIRVMVVQGQSDEDVMVNILQTPAWQKRLNLHAAAEKARERLRLQRIADRQAKARRIANLPRDQRMTAWGSFRPTMISAWVGGPLHDHLEAQTQWFRDMEKFARNEQFHRDNLKRKTEESRVYEATRARLQAEEKARRDKQRGVRLAALEQEITLEEAQLYVRTTVPDYQLESFRRWFRREYDGDTACLVAGVNEFMGVTDEVAPPAAPVIAIASPEVAAPVVKPVAVAPAAPRKREGNLTTVRSRPDQAAFAQSVKENCYSQCVITGTRLLARCEAAHLVEHKHNGADHYTNGLLMRADIHALFDAGFCAIDPATLVVCFTDEALALDPDLAAYHGKAIAPTRKPINADFLVKRWEAFTA